MYHIYIHVDIRFVNQRSEDWPIHIDQQAVQWVFTERQPCARYWIRQETKADRSE